MTAVTRCCRSACSSSRTTHFIASPWLDLPVSRSFIVQWPWPTMVLTRIRKGNRTSELVGQSCPAPISYNSTSPVEKKNFPLRLPLSKMDMDIEKSEDELELERLVFGDSTDVKDRLRGKIDKDSISKTDLEHLEDDQAHTPLCYNVSLITPVILYRCWSET